MQLTQGVQGTQGIQGTAGTLSSAYAFIYNTAAQTVAVGSDVLFDSNGPLLDIQHTAGNGDFTIGSTGTYLLTFQVGVDTDSNQFALFLGGAAVAGGRFGVDQTPIVDAATVPNYGQMIFDADAGATASLRNNDSTGGTVTLPATIGGTQTTTNASIVIHRIN